MTLKTIVNKIFDILYTSFCSVHVKKKGLLAILTNELFHIIQLLLLQKSCLERKESLKLKSTQISISSRRKSSLISCLIAFFFLKFPRKTNFPLHFERKKSPKFFHLDLQSSEIYFPIHAIFKDLLNAMMSKKHRLILSLFPSQRNLKSKSFISFNDLKHVRNEYKM